MSRKKYFPDLDDSDVVFQFDQDIDSEPSTHTHTAAQQSASDSSDDEAPEDISFETGKKSAFEAAKAEARSLRLLKQTSKLKRRQLDELFKSQKEQKAKRLEELSKKKLPQEFLDSLLDEEEKPAVNMADRATEMNTFRKPVSRKRAKMDKDFIPLKDGADSGTQFYVAVLESKRWQKPGIEPQTEVANFRTKALFNPRIRREPVAAAIKAQAKQRAGSANRFVVSK